MSLVKIKRFLLDLKDDILDFIYPQACPICRNSLKREEADVCEECWKALALLPSPYCPYCASFLENQDDITNHQCPNLSRPRDRRILAVRSLGTFDDHYQKLVHRLKYDKKIPLGRRLARKLGESIKQERSFPGCDMVIPVPLHRARHRARGLNQSEVLAEGISRVTDIPSGKNILRRKKNTKDQTYLNAQQRAENVKGAFVVTQPEKINSKRVILVDDVMTTGATLNECARVLLDSGAEDVFAVTLAVVVE
ncbi:MAG: ComF family protein [Candidatus Zixiibacteriota bacterium]|nr:MAG: ComF family protein [candidate division Zixibacteria bacterium]